MNEPVYNWPDESMKIDRQAWQVACDELPSGTPLALLVKRAQAIKELLTAQKAKTL